MKDITTVIFDMYGVILEEIKGNFIPYTFNRFDVSQHDRLTRQIREEKLFTKATNGELSSDEFLSLLGYDNPEHHMKDYIENHLTLDSGFIPFAENMGIGSILFNRDNEKYDGTVVNSFAELDEVFSAILQP